MIKALQRLHADSDSFRERRTESQKGGKKEENHVCSTKPVVSKGSIEAWSKRVLTCQPSLTKSLSSSLSLICITHIKTPKYTQRQICLFPPFFNLINNQQFQNMCIHLRRYKSALNHPQLSLSSISASIPRNSPAGEQGQLLGWATTSLGSYAGSSSSTVHTYSHLFEAASHQLRIMIIQDREEKRGVPAI